MITFLVRSNLNPSASMGSCSASDEGVEVPSGEFSSVLEAGGWFLAGRCSEFLRRMSLESTCP